ncbi:endonuclease domain-containing protein [Paenibacillus sp. MBLB2552]|uniref:Endonuclease domain-containing protein n=1 Tax=Paenibacillus mellifer TaxID=2937794 RepID=A0A9X1Y378_9BACL|nr:endonuclease domain-containing protein [Paenibacillus mellifer]MCK8490107.1 endonuclease domain-containing protein [Paenibacillus mellifer]
MEFDETHQRWLASHRKHRSGERKDRLERGHGHGEQLFLRNVWWPLRGSLDNLHPEYEIADWRGWPYFADFAWLTEAVKLIIEIKGFGPHVRDMDRTMYSRELNREIFLQALGYRVISLSYDDVERQPEICIMLLRMLMSRFEVSGQCDLAKIALKSTLLQAVQIGKSIRPKDVERQLGVNHRTAVRYLQQLCQQGWLHAHSSGISGRVLMYDVVRRDWDAFDW